MLSSTAMRAKSWLVWYVRATPRRAISWAGRRVIGSAPSVTVPASGAEKPDIKFNTVVLPAPFGPIRLVMKPARAVKVRASTARSPPNDTPSPVTTSEASAPRSARHAGRSDVARGAVDDARARRARRSVPAMPSGTSHSTPSRRTPKTSSRYSATRARASGRSTTTAAPSSGPTTVSTPPTMTTRRNRIDWRNEKLPGVTNAVSGEKNAPATPVASADSVNAMVRIRTVSSPIEPAAISESRTARMARPHGLRARRANSQSTAAVTTITSTASARSLNASPAIVGGGMFMSPFAPPVSPCHSTAAFSTMNPKAIVTMAR